MNSGLPQVVDPEVSRAKFEAEVAAYHRVQREQQERGIWLLDVEFPHVMAVMAAPQLRPPAVVCGVLLDYTNYDLEPPSVQLVNPFTRVPYKAKDLPTSLLRKQRIGAPGAIAGIPGAEMVSMVPLMQAHDPNQVPFLCVAGVREYHNHPAHTGDSWMLHRGRGSGTLIHLLHTIYQYGVQPINEYGVGIRVVGFQQTEPPA